MDFFKSATADLPKSAGRNSHPQFAEFLKSATADLPEIFRQKFPPSLKISSNLPLQIYQKSSGRNFPLLCKFPQICHCGFTRNPQAEILTPQFEDFLKSATADLPKFLQAEIPPFGDFLKSATADLPKSAGSNSHPPVCKFHQICHYRFTEICRQKFPPFVDFLKSATADLPKIFRQKFPPVCIFP